MTTKEIVLAYYEGIAAKSGWETLLSEEITFTDPPLKISADGKEAFINSLNQFLRVVKTVRVKKMITENNNAFVLANYHLVSPKGNSLNLDVAEIWEVNQGKLNSLTIYFDTPAFLALMAE